MVPELTGVICKFSVGRVADLHDREGKVFQQEVDMFAVYGDDPLSENGRFWTATPSGQLKLTINNTDAFGFFKPGDAMYVRLSKAEA